jgi:RNA 2',3'-cyclic 3'-phosphodiesterase
MRLFTAIDLPSEVIDNLRNLSDHLRPTTPTQRWSPTANLHITTKFIGEWPADRLAELQETLRALPQRQPFQAAVRGLGWFPNPHNPRVFWAGVQAPEDLRRLAGETDRALGRLGVAVEDRPYSPHLTLARIGSPAGLTELRQQIAALPSVEFGEFPVSSFHLYLSKPGRGGSVYTSLAEFPFQP